MFLLELSSYFVTGLCCEHEMSVTRSLNTKRPENAQAAQQAFLSIYTYSIKRKAPDSKQGSFLEHACAWSCVPSLSMHVHGHVFLPLACMCMVMCSFLEHACAWSCVPSLSMHVHGHVFLPRAYMHMVMCFFLEHTCTWCTCVSV